MGSWPGTDVRETLAVVRDLLADPGDGAEGLPYLPGCPTAVPAPTSSVAASGCWSTCPWTCSPPAGG